MVTTKLSEVVGKGWGWYSSPSSTGESSSADANPMPPNVTTVGSSSSSSSSGMVGVTATSTPSKYWDYANDAAEHTYSTLASYVASSIGWSPSAGGISDTYSDTSSMEPMVMENMPQAIPKNRRTSSILTSPSFLNLFHNPYVAVRGGLNHQAYRPTSSMDAIRSLISAVPANQLGSTDCPSETSSFVHQDSSLGISETSSHGMPAATNLSERGSLGPGQSSPSETASQLAEGTLRAFRDIALDEAVELHQALRYWSYRWERPLLSWLEAGPSVWFSDEGYDHQKVGQKVSQIQAVLARRCATIGDLQSHLLRAGWQRGVAQWGVLGAGGEWATVAGGDGRMMSEPFQSSPSPPIPLVPPPAYAMRRVSSEYMDNFPSFGRQQLVRTTPNSTNTSRVPQQSRHNQLYYTNVFVKHNDGGHIMIDDPALAEWSVDAMALVRLQLFRAANGQIILPYTENWAEGEDQSRLSYDVAGSLVLDAETAATDETVAAGKLPLWASHRLKMEDEDSAYPTTDMDADRPTRVQISDLPLLVNEVSELLDIMDSIIQMQRARRLEKLQPPNWWRRNWYVGALVCPPLLYFSFKAVVKGYGLAFLKSTAKQFSHFFQEHVMDPLMAMYDEFTKGTVDISDREARNVAIKNLRKMIRSWLDETHPDMPLKERKRMAKAMDISLIEAEKEESMKTIYNINSVIRMSFIEAQFLKKEMMNALLAMDEMRAATNFNMNLAAVTPFILLVWVTQKAFKFVFYATLRMGKSREETYGSFFFILTEIERLLVMRDNPPAPSSHQPVSHDHVSQSSMGDCVLSADDLGMLMLHIHELRTVLWQDRRRFSPNIARSVSEDLAELAGERGAVSVRQQLQIIMRMCRTYPFLRAVTDRMFEYR